MKISSSFNWSGQTIPLTYQDVDSFEGIESFSQVYGICFVDEQIAVCYNADLNSWVLPGGTPDTSESFEATLRREVLEEAGLEVLSYRPIGIQYAGSAKDKLQLRAVCRCRLKQAINDPTGNITEMKLVSPEEAKSLLNWGEIGEHLVERAIGLQNGL